MWHFIAEIAFDGLLSLLSWRYKERDSLASIWLAVGGVAVMIGTLLGLLWFIDSLR